MTGKLKFKGSWRSYQKRILDSLSVHLQDRKLHVVAAPGAGKTTLGIEVISRLKAPSVVLCPTNTIKNQWQQRICSSFLEEKDFDIVSTDIRNPKFITVITYQALLAAFKGEDEINTSSDDDEQEEKSAKRSKRFQMDKADKIIEGLKKEGISVLCFDEAHHLRKEWWKALTYLVENLNPRHTLALTATPPYDVEPEEWENYEELCGPIDEIISIPELVKTGDLCPHQDFIHYSGLSRSEVEMVEKYNQKTGVFLGKILSDKELLEYLKAMSFLEASTEEDIAKILDDPDFYVSIVSILKSAGVPISKKLLKLFKAKPSEIPQIDLNRINIFINGFIFTHKTDFPGLENKIENYYNLAKHSGLIQNNKIALNNSEKIRKQISNSIGKLDSIVEIAKSEYSTLGNALRMVVLADYIKEDDTLNSSLGVIPIWRTLKHELVNVPIGVLCGSVILLPKSCLLLLNALLSQNELTEEAVFVSDYKEDTNYIKLTPKDSVKNLIVSLVTEIFTQGGVNILVGTQSLLGEGWDAPCINSLILSSTVSSYMLSNQMRGRAIRIDKNNPDKVSNIWHLASVKVPEISEYFKMYAPQNIPQYTKEELFEASGTNLYDIKQLEKRFEGFEAPSYFGNNEIVSGLDRIVNNEIYSQAAVMGENAFIKTNVNSLKLAADREGTRRNWIKGLSNTDGKKYGGYSGMTTGVDVPKMSLKRLQYSSLLALYVDFCIMFLVSISYLFAIFNYLFIYLIPIIAIVFIGVTVWFIIMYIKKGSPAGILQQIAIVMLETANALDYITIPEGTKNKKPEVWDLRGNLYVTYRNIPVEDNNFLIKCLQEFLDPVENPRYVLIKEQRKFFLKQVDYYSIPAAFSTKKSDIEIFTRNWENYIGLCKIVYTRNYQGRKILLKARNNAFSSIRRPKAKRLSKWQ